MNWIDLAQDRDKCGKCGEHPWLNKDPLASQEGPCSMELVNYNVSLFLATPSRWNFGFLDFRFTDFLFCAPIFTLKTSQPEVEKVGECAGVCDQQWSLNNDHYQRSSWRTNNNNNNNHDIPWPSVPPVRHAAWRVCAGYNSRWPVAISRQRADCFYIRAIRQHFGIWFINVLYFN